MKWSEIFGWVFVRLCVCFFFTSEGPRACAHTTLSGMLAYLAEKIAEEAPTRNWDGPDAECDSEDDEATEEVLCGVELQEVWCRDGPQWEQPCAVVVALRGAGTALLRSAYPDAVVQGVLAIENRLLDSPPPTLFTTPLFTFLVAPTQSVAQVC